MANKSSNSNLTNAKNAKKDEFYNDAVQNPQPGKGEPVKGKISALTKIVREELYLMLVEEAKYFG